MVKKNNTKMKKYLGCGIILLIFLFIGYHIIVYMNDYSMETIYDLNKSINIPYKLGEALDKNEMNGREWANQENYDSGSYYSDNEEVYGYRGFPDLSDSYKLTYYNTTSRNVSVFGIKVGGKADKLFIKLKKEGYKVYEMNRDYVSFLKGRVHIDFDIESNLNGNQFKKEMLKKGVITKVTIRLDSKDKYHKGYYK